MDNDILKSVRESLESLPPLIKYPALLLLCESINELLPQAEKEYNEERLSILKRFIELIKEVGIYD